VRDPDARPRASALASDLRSAMRQQPARSTPKRGKPVSPPSLPPAFAPAARAVPVALAVLVAALGATLLPFWPPGLVAAIVLGAGLAAILDPRLGLAVALAAPVFPLGNVSEGAALVYGAIALALVVLAWRDGRSGLLFACGPLLAPLGLLALVPLLVQPARGAARRGLQAALAVLSAALVAGVAGEELPLTGERATALGVGPNDPASRVAGELWSWLALEPAILSGAAVSAVAAASLSRARRVSRYGVAAVGVALVAATVASGAGIGSVLLVALVWGVAGAIAAGIRR
jgi:hypothetical protein